MSKFELLNRCGPPVSRSRWFEHGFPKSAEPAHSKGLVLMEEWIYVFGSNRFRRYIRIVNGRIVAIDQGDKGG